MQRAPNAFMRTRPLELVRDFIHDSLYNSVYGYFQTKIDIVPALHLGEGKKFEIPFDSISGYNDYQLQIQQLYQGSDKEEEKFSGRWHTPSELFFPHYGAAIGRYLVKEVKRLNLEKLKILEIGPGNGRLCQSILSFIERENPLLFSTTEYHLLDVCTRFHLKQYTQLSPEFQNNCRFHRGSALREADLARCHTGSDSGDHWIILAFEVLDNLPHDKIRYASDGSLWEAVVESNDNAHYGQQPAREVFQPVQDRAILELIEALNAVDYRYPSLKRFFPDSVYDAIFTDYNPWSTEFVPIAAFRLLKNITRVFQKHTLLLSDFSTLPNRVPGYCGPLVQTCLRGVTTAVPTYLVKRGFFDIMFQTNFPVLSQLYKHLQKHRPNCSASVSSHPDLMKQYADLKKTRLRDGFNPLLDEYLNVHVFEACST